MVEHKAMQLDAVFSALGDPTRRAILARLATGEASVGDLAAPYDMSLQAVSKHLGVLEDAGLIHRRKEGRIVQCRLVPAPLAGAADWIGKTRDFWERRLDTLGDYLDTLQSDRRGKA